MASIQKEALRKLKEHLEAMEGEYIIDGKFIDLVQQAFGWNEQKGPDEIKQQIKWEASKLLSKVNDLTSKLENAGFANTLKVAIFSTINPWYTPEYGTDMKVIQEDFEVFLLTVHAFELFMSAFILEKPPERNAAGPVQSTVNIAANAAIWMGTYRKLHNADIIRIQVNIVREIRVLNIFNIEMEAGEGALALLARYGPRAGRALRVVGRFSEVLLPIFIGYEIYSASSNKKEALGYLQKVQKALMLCLEDS